jgi:hypothetical protein
MDVTITAHSASPSLKEDNTEIDLWKKSSQKSIPLKNKEEKKSSSQESISQHEEVQIPDTLKNPNFLYF